MNETELVRAASGGDRAAFCELYDMYRMRLYRYAFYKLGSREDAEDAVSSCILSAWQEIGEIKESKAFPAWIFRILRASCAKILKEKIGRKDDLSEDALESVKASEEDPDTRLILMEALGTLSPESREMVLLSAVAGLSSKEIGDLYDMPAGTVRSRISRSMSDMRQVLEK